jgi:hypothetical protein
VKKHGMTPFTRQAHEIKVREAAERVDDLNTPSIAEKSHKTATAELSDHRHTFTLTCLNRRHITGTCFPTLTFGFSYVHTSCVQDTANTWVNVKGKCTRPALLLGCYVAQSYGPRRQNRDATHDDLHSVRAFHVT